MSKGRLEAFSDGVLAIILTIMVLELRAPSDPNFSGLAHLGGAFLSYVLSFLYVAIYWNNHHHMLQATHHITGRVLWANTHLLFWLSLIPFVTHWSDATGFSPTPVAAYGVVLFMAGFAYYVLARALLACHEASSALAKAIGKDRKGKLSLVIYAVAVGSAFVDTRISGVLYAVVAAMWLIPDLRIERELTHAEKAE